MPARTTIDLTARVHDQCVLETRLASRLRSAQRDERMQLYSQVYDEYIAAFPECIPQDATITERTTRFETAFLRRFLTASTVMAEIGPGRCHLAFAVAPLVSKIYGADVASSADTGHAPANFELRLTDGIHMPFDTDSLDLVISNQLMEHLHPEDASEQLREIYRVLRKGGSYICVTPSRVNGPHDLSACFADLPCPVHRGHYQATGLHLKEYTTAELQAAFKAVGFTRVHTWIGARGRYILLPASIIRSLEAAARLIPPDRRKRSKLLGVVIGNRMRAIK